MKWQCLGTTQCESQMIIACRQESCKVKAQVLRWQGRADTLKYTEMQKFLGHRLEGMETENGDIRIFIETMQDSEFLFFFPPSKLEWFGSEPELFGDKLSFLLFCTMSET